MVEAVTRTAPRLIRRTMLTEQWRDLMFLHRPVPPKQVAQRRRHGRASFALTSGGTGGGRQPVDDRLRRRE